MTEPSAAKQLRDAILQLEMISQVPASRPGHTSKSTDEDIGGRRPSGGIDRADDREHDFALKSAEHYRRREARCHTDGQRLALLVEVERTLTAWRQTPLVDGKRPAMNDPRWKQWVGECEHTVTELVRWYSCSRQYIHQVRKAYSPEKAA